MSEFSAPVIPRQDQGPLFADSGIKLGVFGLNVTSAGAISRSANRHAIDWDQNVRLVQQAEAAGFEAAIPFSRWRGFEGQSNPWGESFEPYTWAAGMAALTSRITVFSTSHCLTVSPVMAAKQIATIDAIAAGRVGLNVVAGWFEKELRMFDVAALGHDERYEYSEEWLDVVLQLWGNDSEFDHRGRWLTVEGGYQQPKPLQKPHPPIMNAAFSPRGHQLAARYADISFVSAFDPASAHNKVTEIRALATQYGRSQQVWLAAGIICAATEQQAANLVQQYSETDADPVAVENAINWTMGGAHIADGQRQQLARSVASTMAGYPLIGTPEHIAEQIGELAAAGIDGLALTWMNYEEGLNQFIAEILPLLQREGIRRNATMSVSHQ